MKNILPLNIEVYEISDLSKKSKDKALLEHVEFLMEVANKKTVSQKEAVKDIILNKYLFDKEGNVLPITSMIKDDKVMNSTLEITKGLKIPVQILDI